MNFLTFIFSLLLLFSFGSLILLEKQAAGRRLRTSYLGHIAANRKILAKCESQMYQSLPSIEKQGESKEKNPLKTNKSPKLPKINPECARLNLWPLIQEGREMHPFLYETALKLLKLYYGCLFIEKPETESLFLNAFLKKAKEGTKNASLCLEKLDVTQEFQLLYYRMLKGSKHWDFLQKIGYPSLLDVIKVEEESSKICLTHAHPGQMSALFGLKAANELYRIIHQKGSEPLSKELIELICSQAHCPIFNPLVFEMIEWKSPSHAKEPNKVFIALDQETKISVRKNIYTKYQK